MLFRARLRRIGRTAFALVQASTPGRNLPGTRGVNANRDGNIPCEKVHGMNVYAAMVYVAGGGWAGGGTIFAMQTAFMSKLHIMKASEKFMKRMNIS